MKHSLVAAALGLFLLAGGTSAQEGNFPEANSWSVTASLPDGGGSLFGFGRFIGTHLHVGFEVDWRDKELEDTGSSAFISPNTVTRDDLIVFGPVVRYYLKDSGPVAPYVRAALGWQRRDIEIEQVNSGQVVQNQEETSTIWRLAVGADWFPTESVGIGFFTGLVGVMNDTDIEVLGGGAITRKTHNISTFKSGIEFQLFFGS